MNATERHPSCTAAAAMAEGAARSLSRSISRAFEMSQFRQNLQVRLHPAVPNEKTGVPGLLVHDFRRSSIRNMIRRGVPQKTARTISGHKTDSVFSRYNIVSEDDIRDAARRIEEGAKAALSNVIPTSFQLAPNQGNSDLAENLQETTTSLHNQEVARLSRSGGTGRRSRLKN